MAKALASLVGKGWRRDLGGGTARSNQSILKETNPEYSLKRTDAEDEAPVLWPPDMKSRLTGKDPDARKDWGQEEKEAAKDEMVGWHHRLNGHEFEQAPRAWRIGEPGVLQSMGSQRVSQTRLNNWTTTECWRGSRDGPGTKDLFYRERVWDPERGSNLPMATQHADSMYWTGTGPISGQVVCVLLSLCS